MNMDVKDLIAKLKSGSGKNSAKGGSSFTAFFDKNPKMKVIIPAVLVAISVLVAIVIIVSTKSIEIDTSPVVGGEAQNVDLLPQDVRDLEDIEVEGGSVFDEVDLADAKYTAVVYNDDGYYTATLQTKLKPDGITVKVGDKLGEWLIESIDEEKIVFALEEEKVVVKYGR